ncbi:oligosaccharide flippase family protein [Terriglobus albidus]|uniref:Oligosaccharide flippase family protein n=1 Tax=Terriglobus albidus TaxID=1592106 RepID=A0A5B9E8Q3_9BACT|nr:oligosaccharide flippase family protein [Terriglobus albidus]QEE28612.1 oligosaccharide flippase family protein [Terriglobus albidus]
MNARSTLFRDMANYLMGRGSLILLGLITFPLLTRLLSVSEYGVLSLTLRIVLVLVVLSKCGLQYSAARFFKAGTSSSMEQRRLYTTLLICPACIVVLVSLLYYAFLLFTPVFRGDRLLYQCLMVAPAVVFFRTLQAILLSFLRNEGKSRLHTIVEITTKVSTLAAFVILAFTGLHHAFPVLLGVLASEFAIVAAQLISFLRRGLFHISAMDWTLIRDSLLFGAPLIIYELSSLVLDSGDRIIVQRYLGDHQLGLYSAAYGVSGYLQDTVMTPLNLAIFPIYMRIWNEEGKPATERFLSTSVSWFSLAALFIVGACALCSREMLTLLASARFAGADRLLTILIPSLMIYALHIFFNVGLILEKRTTLLAGIAASAAVLNIALNLYLVPRFGLMGAAFATFLGYVVMVASLIVINRKFLPLTPSASLILSGVAAVALAYPLPSFTTFHLTVVTLLVRLASYTIIFLLSMLAISSSFRKLWLTAWKQLVSRFAFRNDTAKIAILEECETSNAGQGVSQ